MIESSKRGGLYLVNVSRRFCRRAGVLKIYVHSRRPWEGCLELRVVTTQHVE
jgi:hypothetical protein